VKSNEILSEKLEVKRGVRQGGSLSPLLFNLVMTERIKDFRHKKGYKIKN
jgi:hypothetical protein